MQNIGEAVTTVDLLTNFFNSFTAMSNSLVSALVALGIVWSTIVTACSVLATKMPTPNETAPTSYKLWHKVINLVAFHYGNAANK